MSETTMKFTTLARRAVLAVLLSVAAFAAAPASAASPAESFVQTNVQKGLSILNNKALSEDQKRSQFQSFLIGLTDMKRIANFTLGVYRKSASPQEQDQFAAAFQAYAIAVYQSYFAKYSGQTLRVTGSTEKSPGDTIVQTMLIDPNDHSGKQPLEVDFRVLTDNGKFVVVDFAVGGIWLAIEERDQFSGFLGQNGGNIQTLIKHLGDLAKSYK